MLKVFFANAITDIQKYRFRLLFISNALFSIILLVPAVNYSIEVLGFLFFVATAFLALMKSEFFGAVLVIGALNLLVYFATFMVDMPASLPVFFLRNIPLILLYIIMSFIVYRHVIRERPVTGEIIYGLGALYLQMGLTFAFAFDLVEHLQPGSLISSYGPIRLDTLVYFSIVTLTTLGYGDIQVATPLARILVCVEGIIGVLFVALVVSRVLSLLNDNK